jgi:hypothetical protein
MKRLIAAFGLLLALTACESEQAPPPAHTSRVAPPKIALDVQVINLADRSGLQPTNSPYNGNRFTPTISDAIKQWAADRLQAAGQSGQAIIVIKDASLIAQPMPVKQGMDGWFTRQQGVKYIGRAEVSIEANGRPGFALADAVATRATTLPENPTAIEKQDAYYTLLNGLMKDLGQNLETGIQTHMGGFIVTPQVYGVTAVPTGNLQQQSGTMQGDGSDGPVIIQSPSPGPMDQMSGGYSGGQPQYANQQSYGNTQPNQQYNQTYTNGPQYSGTYGGTAQMGGMQQGMQNGGMAYSNGQMAGNMQMGNAGYMNNAVADATVPIPQQVPVSPPTMTISQSNAPSMQSNMQSGMQYGMQQMAPPNGAPMNLYAQNGYQGNNSSVTAMPLPPPQAPMFTNYGMQPQQDMSQQQYGYSQNAPNQNPYNQNSYNQNSYNTNSGGQSSSQPSYGQQSYGSQSGGPPSGTEPAPQPYAGYDTSYGTPPAPPASYNNAPNNNYAQNTYAPNTYAPQQAAVTTYPSSYGGNGPVPQQWQQPQTYYSSNNGMAPQPAPNNSVQTFAPPLPQPGNDYGTYAANGSMQMAPRGAPATIPLSAGPTYYAR